MKGGLDVVCGLALVARSLVCNGRVSQSAEECDSNARVRNTGTDGGSFFSQHSWQLATSRVATSSKRPPSARQICELAPSIVPRC